MDPARPDCLLGVDENWRGIAAALAPENKS